MKTTIDLPDDLVRRLKVRALRDGKKLKELTAELLSQALIAPSQDKNDAPRAIITKDKKTGLPVIRSSKPKRPSAHLTPDQVADILLQQEVDWSLEATR
jgi:plasmid stability protein